MRVINKDLTKEKIFVNVSGGQIYIEVFSKVKGKWKIESYFEEYNFEVDKELTNLTISTVKRLWNLKSPKVYLAFGN